LPRWSMTTTAPASSPVRICRWPWRAFRPRPGDDDPIGSGIWVSRATVTTVAVLNTRRPGRQPDRQDAALPEPLVTAADGLDGDALRPTRDLGAAARRAEPSCRPRSRFSGVNRQISVTTTGHLEGVDVERAELLALVDGGEARTSTAAVRFCATSRPRLPSAAR
jgi:hypothetical protein